MNPELNDQVINSLSSTASERESSYAGDLCEQTKVPTAKFYDAVQISNSDDLQQSYCNSSYEEDATTVANETKVEAETLSALTPDERSHGVDMQVQSNAKTLLLVQSPQNPECLVPQTGFANTHTDEIQ